MINRSNSFQVRIRFMSSLTSLLILALLVFSCTGNKAELYLSMDKIDAHVHIRTTDPVFMEYAASEGFRLLTINTRSKCRVAFAIYAKIFSRGSGRIAVDPRSIRRFTLPMDTCIASGCVVHDAEDTRSVR